MRIHWLKRACSAASWTQTTLPQICKGDWLWWIQVPGTEKSQRMKGMKRNHWTKRLSRIDYKTSKIRWNRSWTSLVQHLLSHLRKARSCIKTVITKCSNKLRCKWWSAWTKICESSTGITIKSSRPKTCKKKQTRAVLKTTSFGGNEDSTNISELNLKRTTII